jgi:hypothetical protein
MTLTQVITYTAWITAGITGYLDNPGDNLACCPGEYGDYAVAAPIEWVLGGYVACGDIAYIELPNGVTVKAPIMDTGCMLHYPVWDSGEPLSMDLPRIVFPAAEYPTATGRVRVYRRELGEWWTPPPMAAWATEYCQGPLSWEWPEDGLRPD